MSLGMPHYFKTISLSEILVSLLIFSACPYATTHTKLQNFFVEKGV